MYSRAQNIEQTANSANQSLQDQFTDYRGRVSDKFSINLEDYSDKLNTDISKEIASRTEGISAISNSPIFFNAGQAAYGYMPKMVQRPFDIVGEYGQDLAQKVGVRATQVGAKIGGELGENLENMVGTAGEHLKNMMGIESLNNPGKLVSSGEDGVTRVNFMDQAADGKSYNMLKAAEGETRLEDGSFRIGTSAEAAEGEIAADAESGLTSALTADAAVAEAGPIGAVAAGIGAAAIGIGYGLGELLGHHQHHPSKPSLNSTIPSFASSYDVGKSVVSTASQQQMPGQTMSF
mgnify:CR=1 FL=1